MIFWHWWLLRQIMIDMLTFSETLHPCSCAKERISGNLEFPNALETVTQRCLIGRSMHMFPQGGQLAMLSVPLVLQPIPYKKTASSAGIVIWSTWTLDDLEFLRSLFQVWLKSHQRIFYTTASIHCLQSIDEAGSLLLSAICLLRWAFCFGFAFRCSFPSLMFALIYIDIK